MRFAALDIVFFVLIAIFAIKAAIKGLVDEFFGLATFIFGAFLAFKFSPKLKPYLSSSMNAVMASILSFVLLFIVFFIVIKILQIIIKGIFSGQILASLDHSLGFIYGLAEGIMFVAIILLLMDKLQPWIDTIGFRDGSFFYSHFGKFLSSYASTAAEELAT